MRQDSIKTLSNQLHFHFSLDKCRIWFISSFLFSLLQLRTVVLTQLSKTLNPSVQSSSNYKRIQRFFRFCELPMKPIGQFLFGLFYQSGTSVVLSMDRTNWQYGKNNINILVIGMVLPNCSICIPLVWELLDKKGFYMI